MIAPKNCPNGLIDAVGAVAVHGYAGFVGLVICGFVLNGYPSSGYSVGAMWDGTTYASINPLGQFLGAIIMFGVLGMLPGYVIAKVLHGCLLYTSPSPRDGLLSRMPSSA